MLAVLENRPMLRLLRLASAGTARPHPRRLWGERPVTAIHQMVEPAGGVAPSPDRSWPTAGVRQRRLQVIASGGRLSCSGWRRRQHCRSLHRMQTPFRPDAAIAGTVAWQRPPWLRRTALNVHKRLALRLAAVLVPLVALSAAATAQTPSCQCDARQITQRRLSQRRRRGDVGLAGGHAGAMAHHPLRLGPQPPAASGRRLGVPIRQRPRRRASRHLPLCVQAGRGRPRRHAGHRQRGTAAVDRQQGRSGSTGPRYSRAATSSCTGS